MSIPLTCSSTRVTMVHVVQPQNVIVSKWTSAGVKTHIREGFLLKLMDLATCASAEQLSGHSSVTFAVDDLIFHDTHLSVGETIVIKAQVNSAWGTSMECGCSVVADDGQKQRRICKAFFTYVSLGPDGKKIKLPKLQAIDADNLRRNHLAQERRKIRFRRAAIIEHAASNIVKAPTLTSSTTTGNSEFDNNIATSETAIAAPPLVMTQIVLPQHANHHGNTFGGQIMAWMSIAARVVASRHVSASASSIGDSASSVVVCKSIDDIFFKASSSTGDRVVIKSRVTRIFARTLEVQCEVHAHQVGGEARLINQAVWVMELMAEEGDADKQTNMKPLLQVDFNFSSEARVAFEQALGRRALRIQRAALGNGHNLDPSWNFEFEPTNRIISEPGDPHGHHVELVARNMSSLLGAYWARGSGSWGVLEQASTASTKLFMRKENGLILVKAVASLSFDSVKNITIDTASKKKRNGLLFGLFRQKSTRSEEKAVNDSETALGRLFSVLCDNTQRKSWDLLCEDCSTVKEIDETNDITRLCFKGIGDQKTKSDFILLRSWRANEDRSRYVIANHSIRTKLCPEVNDVKRGTVGSSGWVIEMVKHGGNGRGEKQEVCELTYLVTLAAAGIQALGGTAIDVLAGRSKIICHNIEGIAKVVNATLL
jgi:acyl-CoA hydrolase